MRYAAKIALRHSLSSPGQTALLILGVALGVTVFIFMSALIGGLATLLTQRTVGSIAHVVLEMPDRSPGLIAPAPGAQLTVQKDLSRRQQIAVWQPFVPLMEEMPGITAVAPQIRGSAFLIRGQAVAPVGVIGVNPDKLSAIANVSAAMVAGEDALPSDGILIGQKLAEDMGLYVGQAVLVRSDRLRERSFRVTGIFSLGIASADRQAAYMNLTTARALFDLPSGISRFELKVAPVGDAPRIAENLGRATGLKVMSWTDENAQLFEALAAQGRTGDIIKGFALVTIMIGIASAMLLSVMRRRSEIGIMRAAGVSRLFILQVFVMEGTLIGVTGAVASALLAFAALAPFPPIAEVQSGGLPIDIHQGGFWIAIILTTLAAAISSIIPARRAARVDPVEAVGQ